MPGIYYHGSPPPETPADHIADLANAFANASSVLAKHYHDLNKATNGLLDGTFPWQGLGADGFSYSWHIFGQYMQQLQKACDNASKTLTTFSNKLEDIEAEQAWNVLMMVAGGILTVISLAASIAEFGLNPFMDGLTALLGTFTEQEGSEVINVAEDITQADSEAAAELEEVDSELSNVPTLGGNDPSAPNMGNVSPLSPANIDEMLIGADADPDQQWFDYIKANYQPYNSEFHMDGVETDYINTCAPDVTKMLLADNGITNFSDQQIMDEVGYQPNEGTSPQGLANGLRQMGLTNAQYDPDMSEAQLQQLTNVEQKPVIVDINQTPDDPQATWHAVIVDRISTDGQWVYIRDPAWVPAQSYALPMSVFEKLWAGGGGISY
jgi:uncharacterized protein YukE